MLSLLAQGQNIGTWIYGDNGIADMSSLGDVYIDSSAVLFVQGSWRLFGVRMIAAEGATVNGVDTMHFISPNPMSGKDTTQLVDGGNNIFNVSWAIQNDNNVEFADLANSVWAMDGKAGATIESALDLRVDDGHFILNDHNMKIGTNGKILNYTENKYIITNAAGSLYRLNLSTMFEAPIGIAEADYTPATLLMKSSYADFEIRVDSGIIPGASKPSEGVDRTWTVRQDTGAAWITTPVVELTLQHNSWTEGTDYDNTNAFVTRYVGFAPNTLGGSKSLTNWDLVPTCHAGTPTGTITTGSAIAGASELTREALDNFVDYVYYTKSTCDATPLPVQLISFEGFGSECNTLLQWSTAMEVNFSHYELERSVDGSGFSFYRFIEGKGGPSKGAVYREEIENSGAAYYRLKMVDLNGDYEYSNIVYVDPPCETNAFKVFPSIYKSGDITIEISVEVAENAIVEVFNEIGQLVGRQNMALHEGQNRLNMDLTMLAKGIYYIRLTGESLTDLPVVKIVKVD